MVKDKSPQSRPIPNIVKEGHEKVMVWDVRNLIAHKE